MAQAGFELDTTDVIRLINKVGDQAPVVAARAVNKSAKSAQVALARAVRQDVGVLKAAEVKDELKVVEARPGPRPAAKIRVSKKRVPLVKFGAVELKRAGVRAKLKGGARKYPGAFIATMKSGHRGVFKRRPYPDTPRLPIRELHGPSLAKVFAKHWGVAHRRFREQLAKNVVSEIRFAARGR